ncbi:MAG: mannonate dehydratase, partial [Gemmatimonadetes bacterium]|nr:mannonate dehydratase [Gemmatimonadota bacterium]
MMKIGLSIPNEPSLALTLMKQCGVEYAVSHQTLQPVEGAPEDEQPWSLASLTKRKQAYEDLGFELAVIEGRPAMEKIKLAL